MTVVTSSQAGARSAPLLRGEVDVIAGWLARLGMGETMKHALAVVIGAGAFGAAMGSWRAPEQALWSAIKLPVVLLATAGGNALLNGMLAPLLGINLRWREAFAAVLLSFALAAVILGALAPVMAFLAWNYPPPGAEGAGAARSVMLLSLVATIAFAGVTANVRLLRLLERLGGGARSARRLLFAWLAVNLLLGTQVSWICRPFIGRIDIPVVFLMERALEGNFFEETARTVVDLWRHFFS